jgi:hypothetical protein
LKSHHSKKRKFEKKKQLKRVSRKTTTEQFFPKEVQGELVEGSESKPEEEESFKESSVRKEEEGRGLGSPDTEPDTGESVQEKSGASEVDLEGSPEKLWQIRANKLLSNPLFVSRNIIESRQQTILNSKSFFKKVISRDLEVQLESPNQPVGQEWFKLVEFYKFKESVYPRKTLIYKKDSPEGEWLSVDKQCTLPLFLETPEGTHPFYSNPRLPHPSLRTSRSFRKANQCTPIVSPEDHQW